MEPVRHRYNIGARKIPYEQRDVVHGVLGAEDDHGYFDIMGADTDAGIELDSEGPIGTYSLLLTEEEAEEFRGASNALYVELDQVCSIPEPLTEPADGTQATTVPEQAVIDWLGATDADLTDVTGVTVAVLDGGTTRAVRNAAGCVLTARENFSPELVPSDDQITSDHGCKVTPLAVPRGAKLIEAIISDRSGRSTHSGSAAAMRWATDLGATVINYSSGGANGSNTMRYAIRYLTTKGAVLVASAGNDGRNTLLYPSAYCRNHGNVKSSIAFTLDRQRASFSNYDDTGSGAAPGRRVLSFDRYAQLVYVSGTSFSAPLMTRLIALGIGAGHTATAVADALEQTAIDTPEPAEEEGRGAWNLRAAMTRLTPATVTPAGQAPWWRDLLLAARRWWALRRWR